MYCERFRATLTTECCIKRQEKAQKQSETMLSFCESLIFCHKCPQGEEASKKANNTKKAIDLDVNTLKKKAIKKYIEEQNYSMFKIKRLKLKRRKYNELSGKCRTKRNND